MDYLFTFSIICSGSGRSCWLLRGLYLSSSLYTFQKCISGLARGRHFSLPRIHPQLALKFLSRGDSMSLDPLCLPHFTNPALFVSVLVFYPAIAGLSSAAFVRTWFTFFRNQFVSPTKQEILYGFSCKSTLINDRFFRTTRSVLFTISQNFFF